MKELIVKLSWATIPLFWPVFLGTCALSVWFAYRTYDRWRSDEPLKLANRTSLITILLLLPYVAFLVWGGDFVYHDNDVFTEHSVRGKTWPIAIWPWEGRYFPLFAQEFNLLGLISPTPGFYYAAVSVQILLFCTLLVSALLDLPTSFAVGIAVTAMMTNSIGIVFSDLIYTERDVVFWLAVLLVATIRHDRKPSRANLATAIVAAQFVLYYKDIAFLLVGTIAVVRLAITWSRSTLPMSAWIKQRPLDVGLLFCTAIYVGQFLLCLLSAQSSRYVEKANVGWLQATLDYLRSDPVLWVFAFALLVRATQVKRFVDLDPLWDAVAIGAAVYFSPLVIMGLSCDRYVAPVDMVGLLYAGRMAATWYVRLPERRILVGAASIAAVGVTAVFGAARLVEYKSIVRGTTKLGNFISKYAAEHPGPVRLYFPNSEHWRLLNIQVYFRFRSEELYERVKFTGPFDFPEGQCVYYYPYKCEKALAPEAGDIVVQLPDDATRTPVPNTSPLFAYSFWPGGMPTIAGVLLHRETPLYAGREMPAGWLTVSAASVLPTLSNRNASD